jgi:hypothetical protein
MKVEQACRLSADGTARTRERIRDRDGMIQEVSLYARFNEVQGKYTVTQYLNRQKIKTSSQFSDPHKTDRWRPSQKFSLEGHPSQRIKSEYCLYLLISREKYQFKLGITSNIYTRIYQLRLIWGEFDLDTSCVVYGKRDHLKKLEEILQFVFDEYHLAPQELNDSVADDWFDLDCFWYVKNEIRRLNSFREEKIYRVFEGIDLNAFIVEDADKLAEQIDIELE